MSSGQGVEAIEITFRLNGAEITAQVDPADRLLDLLRYQLQLTGTKEGCGEGECGACSVLMDGLPVNSCLVPVYQVRGREIRTVESTTADEVAPLLAAGATQCGACTPGVVITSRWIRDNPELLDRFEPRDLMAGNLCRCTGYDGIIAGLSALTAPERED